MTQTATAPVRGPGDATQRRPAGRRRINLAAGTFSLPGIALVAGLLYLPFLYTVYLGFTRYNGLGSPAWTSWDNYKTIFHDPDLATAARNTLLWVVGTVTVPVGLGLLLATATYGRRFGTLVRLPFLLPYAVSGVGVGVVWSFILETGGALGQALDAAHLPGGGTGWLLDAPTNTIAMTAASSWQSVGVNALLFVVGLQSIPKEPLEAARLDGATGFRLFRHITWPLLRPITTVVVGLSIVGSLKTFDIVWVMTQGGPGASSETFAVSMYKQTFVAGDYGVGSALAVSLTVLTLVVSVFYLRRQLTGAKAV
jgi:ABC-type sugar transport system permease subunit